MKHKSKRSDSDNTTSSERTPGFEEAYIDKELHNEHDVMGTEAKANHDHPLNEDSEQVNRKLGSPAVQRSSQEKQQQNARTNKRLRRGIRLGVVGVFALTFACAGWVWHEDAGFCGAFCHKPMDAYVAGYYATAGEPTVDAYGKEVSDSSAMLIASHAQEGVGCLECHPADITQQLGEAGSWVTGEYEFPLVEKDLVQLLEGAHQPAEGNGSDFCMVEGCHVDTEGEPLTDASLRTVLKDKPGYKLRNPHVVPSSSAHALLEYSCSDCHKSHRASTNACTRCHYDLVPLLPSGWEPWAISTGTLTQIHEP